MSPQAAVFLADLIVVSHVLVVLLVVLPLPLIIIGGIRGWGWVRRFWLRAGHVALIGYITFNTVLGNLCPLTLWENALRQRGGQAGYEGDFIAQYAHRLIYYQAPPGVFLAIYAGFALAVALAWFLWPPRAKRLQPPASATSA